MNRDRLQVGNERYTSIEKGAIEIERRVARVRNYASTEAVGLRLEMIDDNR